MAPTTLLARLLGGWRPPRAERAELRRILSYIAPFRARALLALVCAAFLAACTIVPAVVVRYIIDDLERPHYSFGSLAWLVAIGIAATVVAGLLNVAENYLTTNIGKGVVARLRQQLFDHLMSQSVGYFARRRAGELMSRILNDVGAIDGVIGSTLLSLVVATLTFAAALVVMFILSWQLSIAVLLLYPAVAVIIRLTRHSLYHRNRAVQEQFAGLTAYLQEILGPSAIMVVKSFGRVEHERATFAATNEEMRRLEIDAGRATRWGGSLLSVIQLLGPVAIVLLGSYLVLHHSISLGTMVAFAAVAMMGLGTAMQGLMTGLFTLLGSLPMWARVFEVLDDEPDVKERPSAVLLSRPLGAITFESVTFSYPNQRQPALRDVSVEISPGQLVALVGPSGAGKTTFTNLVARFYDPQQGRVAMDGNDVRDVTLGSLSDAVGLVLQDTFLFHASLRDNLLYGRPEATDVELDRAVRHAALEDVIAGLPDGYETVVGDRGHRLSGGERQRVAIARAILKDPPIMILDEATSHLDSIAEELIQTAMAELSRGRTSIVIAHRLSTVRAADHIVVLDHGGVAEHGNHDELRRAGGLYSTMYDTQFAAAG